MERNWRDSLVKREGAGLQVASPHQREKSTKPLIGWRVWRLGAILVMDKEGKEGELPRLYSVSARHVEWNSPVMRTKNGTTPASFIEKSTSCGISSGYDLPHPKNSETHDYGVYAYKDPVLCVSYLGSSYPVIGRLALSGVVVEHELGYRAEIVTIRELWVMENNVLFPSSLPSFLMEMYKCDVHLLKVPNLVGWARWYKGEYPNQREE